MLLSGGHYKQKIVTPINKWRYTVIHTRVDIRV